jgi:hypothetical protein
MFTVDSSARRDANGSKTSYSLPRALPLASGDRFPGAVGVLNPVETLFGLPTGTHGLAGLKGRHFLLGAGGIENVDFGGDSAHVGGGVLVRNFVEPLPIAACALSSGAARAAAGRGVDQNAPPAHRTRPTPPNSGAGGSEPPDARKPNQK